MTKVSERALLKGVCNRAKVKKRIKKADQVSLSAAFGQRFTKAWEAIEGRRVKKYLFRPSNRVVWIVVGKEQDYLIMPAAYFCSCDDFYFRVMDREIHLCYHLIAQKLAETLERFDLFEEEDELHDVLMKEWKKAIA